MGKGDVRLPGTDRKLTDVTMVPPILMAGIRSASYKTQRSDRTLTGATLDMEILKQCGKSTRRDFKTSSMNHGKGSVVGQLNPVEYNKLTVSETVSIDEPSGGYMEIVEYRNSARGHLIALENEGAMECYLETTIQGTTVKQKTYGTLVSSEMHAETIDQLVGLPWRAVVLRHFEEEMTTIRFAWCMDWTDEGRLRFGRKEKIERRKSVLDDECERSNDPRRGGSSVCETERRSMFHSIYVRTNNGTSVKHLCQEAERRQ